MRICDEHVHHIIFHAKFEGFFKEVTIFILFFNLALNNFQQIVIFHLLFRLKCYLCQSPSL